VPDHRGRTGLDQQGRDLHRNPRVRIRDVELLAAGLLDDDDPETAIRREAQEELGSGSASSSTPSTST